MAFGIVNVAKQPCKTIYIGCSHLSLLVLRVPWWTIRNLLPAWRPRRTWSIARCIQVNLVKYFMTLGVKFGGLRKWPDHRKLELGKGINGLLVDGVPELLSGRVKEWAASAGVSPIRIPGYWQHKHTTYMVMGEKPRTGEKVVYFLHGGGYVSLSAHPTSPTSGIARAIMVQCPSVSRTFAVEYRLSSWDPRPRTNPFPAALLDALAGYSYLVNTVGFAPSDVVVVGDSAGGNLALALTRYLIEDAERLPAPPGALVLLSPWTDLSGSHEAPGSSEFTCTQTDFLSPPTVPRTPGYSPRALAGPHGEEFIANIYISPARKSLDPGPIAFKGFPKSFVVVGDAEQFLDQVRTLRSRMVADMGERHVVYLESRDAFHDFIGFPWFEPQRQEALSAIGTWIEKL